MKLTGAVVKRDLNDLGVGHYVSGHHKIPRIWIILADKKITKIFSKADNSFEMIGEAYPSEGVKMAITEETIENTKDVFGNSEQIQYAPSMSPVRRQAYKFVHELSGWLDEALQKEAFDRLILVAPPQTLSDMRKTLSKPVASRVVAEVNKDLTKISEENLYEGLEKIA